MIKITREKVFNLATEKELDSRVICDWILKNLSMFRNDFILRSDFSLNALRKQSRSRQFEYKRILSRIGKVATCFKIRNKETLWLWTAIDICHRGGKREIWLHAATTGVFFSPFLLAFLLSPFSLPKDESFQNIFWPRNDRENIENENMPISSGFFLPHTHTDLSSIFSALFPLFAL